MLNPSERLESSLIIRKGPKSLDGHQFHYKLILYNSISAGKQFFNAGLLSYDYQKQFKL